MIAVDVAFYRIEMRACDSSIHRVHPIGKTMSPILEFGSILVASHFEDRDFAEQLIFESPEAAEQTIGGPTSVSSLCDQLDGPNVRKLL